MEDLKEESNVLCCQGDAITNTATCKGYAACPGREKCLPSVCSAWQIGQWSGAWPWLPHKFVSAEPKGLIGWAIWLWSQALSWQTPREWWCGQEEKCITWNTGAMASNTTATRLNADPQRSRFLPVANRWLIFIRPTVIYGILIVKEVLKDDLRWKACCQDAMIILSVSS